MTTTNALHTIRTIAILLAGSMYFQIPFELIDALKTQ